MLCLRWMLCTGILSSFLFGFSGTASAATYYVDGASLGGTCNDSNNGTALSTPWCTIQQAASTAVAGDTINIRAGTYRETVTPANSGTSGNPITYQAYSGETPTVNGADLITSWSSLGDDETGGSGLFVTGFEDNDIGNYSVGVTANNTVTISSTFANHGSYSLAETYDGTQRNARINKTITATADVYSRFYFRLSDSYSLTANDVGQLVYQLRLDSSVNRAQLFLLKDSSGQFYLQGKAINPANNTATTIFTGTPGTIATSTWYNVEIRYKGGDASTGGAEFWLDGVSQGSNYTFNTSTTTLSRMELGGSTSGSGVPTAGSVFYIDDVNASSSPLGAFSAGDPDIYKASTTWRINQVFVDSTKLATSSSVGTITPGYWYNDLGNDLLYVKLSNSSDPTSHTVEASHRNNAFVINSKNYLTFNGINAKYTNYTNSTAASGKVYAVATSSNITIENSTISYNFGSGVYFTNTSTSTITGNTFIDNEKQFGGGIRLEAGSNNNMISYNSITGIGLLGGNGIVLCGDDDCQNMGNHYNTIKNNSFYNLFDSCVYVTSRSNYTLFENNICGLAFRHIASNGGAAGGAGIHVSRGSNNTTIRNNLFYDTEGASIAVQSDSIEGVEITTDGTLVYNNTVYNPATLVTSQAGITFSGTTTNSVVRNNIVYQSNAYSLRITDSSTSSISIDYNIYYSTQGSSLVRWDATEYSTLASYQAVSAQDAHSLNVNPLLTNAAAHTFTLQAASPAFEAGETVDSVLYDYIGTSRPQGRAYDIGAYETAYTAPSASSGGGGGVMGGGSLSLGFVNNPSHTLGTSTTGSLATVLLTSYLTETQIQSILSLLSSFGADQEVIDKVNLSLRGQVAPPNSSKSAKFTRNLKLNDTGNDVRLLQQYLNAHGFLLANSGPGSVGHETTLFGDATQYQLIQFQKAHNIAPASGYFGPITRVYVEAHE